MKLNGYVRWCESCCGDLCEKYGSMLRDKPSAGPFSCPLAKRSAHTWWLSSESIVYDFHYCNIVTVHRENGP